MNPVEHSTIRDIALSAIRSFHNPKSKRSCPTRFNDSECDDRPKWKLHNGRVIGCISAVWNLWKTALLGITLRTHSLKDRGHRALRRPLTTSASVLEHFSIFLSLFYPSFPLLWSLVALMVTSGAPEVGKGEIPILTPLISLWAFSTFLWSIFTPPDRTFAARVLLLQPLWLVRILSEDLTWTQDLALFLGLHSFYGWWTGVWRFFTIDDLKWLNIHDDVIRVYLQVFALLGGCGALAGMIVYRGHRLESTENNETLREQRIEEALLAPLLIPSRTTHSRLIPAKHAFSYSYLFVGIPVDFRGHVRNILSVDSPRPAWFSIDSSDYLNRGNSPAGLEWKLKRYLHSQSVTDKDYAYGYLVTAPRFAGYSFNPISFWYLYDSDTRLQFMVLEVNNTFDERRMYLLKAKIPAKADSDAASKGWSKMVSFKDTWDKDFHVSPFNSRKGSYSLRAVDPLAAYQETGYVKIDNVITLRSSEDNAEIVTRVWSDGVPKVPEHISTFELLWFIANWWWVGLATFPRIVWEAQKLFFRSKLQVWYRPEVSDQSIGRSYSPDEVVLESFFRAFLTHIVENAKEPLRVIYEAAHSHSEEIVLYSPGFTYEEDKPRTLTFKVLSPAFYSRFIHYAHVKEAFDRECLATDEKNRTLVMESPNLLPVLIGAMKGSEESSNAACRRRSLLGQYRWACLRCLRCPPAAASYPPDSSRLDQEFVVHDIRAFHFSELDKFVQLHCHDGDTYRRAATKLFVAERYLFGLPVVAIFCDWILRSLLLVASMIYCQNCNLYDVLRPRDFVSKDILIGFVGLLLANAIHLWSFIKG